MTPDDIVPTQIYEGWSKCPACGNRRVSLGETYPPMDTHEQRMALVMQDYDVDTNTVRDQSCSLCKGSSYPGPSVASICGVRLMSFDLQRIVSLPDVRVCRGNSGKCILFRAGGFEGVAMGLMK